VATPYSSSYNHNTPQHTTIPFKPAGAGVSFMYVHNSTHTHLKNCEAE